MGKSESSGNERTKDFCTVLKGRECLVSMTVMIKSLEEDDLGTRNDGIGDGDSTIVLFPMKALQVAVDIFCV